MSRCVFPRTFYRQNYLHEMLCLRGLCLLVSGIGMWCASGGRRYSYGADASAEGVQRDLLPLIEGSTISTKYGNIKSKTTRHELRPLLFRMCHVSL